MNEQAKKATKRKQRWLKVSLRTFFLAITVLCVWLGFIVNRANKQKQAVAWVYANGGTVRYDFEWSDREGYIADGQGQPPGPDWLREWIGIEYFADVKAVFLSDTSVIDIEPLAGMTDLRHLNLSGTQVSDLTSLDGLNRLQWLDLRGTRVIDLEPLVGMKDVFVTLNPYQQVIIPPELKPRVFRYNYLRAK